MPTGSYVKTVNVDGDDFRTTRTPAATGKTVRGDTLPAAKTGQLTTRTDNNTGTLTMAAGHGFNTGDKLHLYWTNADGSKGFAYTVAGTVSTNSVPIDSGAGDDLPPNLTNVTAMVPTTYDFVVEYANLKLLTWKADTAVGAAVLRESGGTVAAALRSTGSTGNYSWDAGDPAASPLAADVASVDVSHGDAAAARPVKLVALVN